MSIDASESSPGTVSRRGLIGGGAVAGVFAAFGRSGDVLAATSRPTRELANGGRRFDTGSSALGFTAVSTSEADEVVVPEGYTAQVLIPWGDPVSPDGPPFKFDGSNTAAEQAEQFGQGHDGMAFFHLSRHRGLLVINHEALDSSVVAVPRPRRLHRPRDRAQGAERPRRQRSPSSSCRGGEWRVVRSGSPGASTPTRRWS